MYCSFFRHQQHHALSALWLYTLSSWLKHLIFIKILRNTSLYYYENYFRRLFVFFFFRRMRRYTAVCVLQSSRARQRHVLLFAICLLLSTATICISEINYDYGIILLLRFKSQWNFLWIDVDCSRRWPGHHHVLAWKRIHRRRTSPTWLKRNRFVWCSLIVKFMFGCSSDWITWCFHSQLGDEMWYGCCAAVAAREW